jgi:hypothetical protein
MPKAHLPSNFHLAALGLRSSDIFASELLRHKSGHIVCRIRTAHGWHVLKWFESPGALEPEVYTLLETCGIPTLPVHARSEQALLLEDLQHSDLWREAGRADMCRMETGTALAEWYRILHLAGRKALQHPEMLPSGLHAWVDDLSVETLAAAGIRMDLAGKPAWVLALDNIELLKRKAQTCLQTFNYEDFAQENLALSRGLEPLQAVVFDYDCFTLGTAYSDWRNVTYSLEGEAREAFAEAYGPVNETERRLDMPLSALFGLLVASRRANVPCWARPLLEDVDNGALERSIQDALEWS